MKTTIDIISVLGVQIALWFFHPWWIALLSLPLAVIIISVMAFAAMPLLSKITATVFWEDYKLYAPPIFFGAGQIISAYILSAIFL